jgi:hypothetical protein
MTIIYGIDTNKPFTPKDVCSAIVECFVEAHKKELNEMKEFLDGATKEELERMKIINVKQMINNFFVEVGGNCDNPTKDDIVLVLGKIKEFAKNFRNPKVIEGHYQKINKLVDKL